MGRGLRRIKRQRKIHQSEKGTLGVKIAMVRGNGPVSQNGDMAITLHEHQRGHKSERRAAWEGVGHGGDRVGRG